MMVAKLPESLEPDTIDTMATGETAYTLPWGMWVDSERQCWLHPKYPANPKPHGTARMRVELRRDGLHVWPPVDETWSPQAEPGYASSRDTDYLPVVELH